jgi:hypothetical protein
MQCGKLSHPDRTNLRKFSIVNINYLINIYNIELLIWHCYKFELADAAICRICKARIHLYNPINYRNLS